MKLKNCCMAWIRITNSIEVSARDFYNAHEKYQAECVEKLLKYLIGNFCPTCGNKLRTNNPRKEN